MLNSDVAFGNRRVTFRMGRLKSERYSDGHFNAIGRSKTKRQQRTCGVDMLKGLIAGVGITVGGALVGGYILLLSGLIPANADATPGWIETWIAGTSLDATLNREAPKGPNPIAVTDTNLINGIDLYAQHCAICHGTENGVASESPVAKGL